MKTNKLRPIHPGEILREEFMKPRGLSQNALARALNVPPRRINEIVLEKRAISADTALRLARYFGTSAEMWAGLQAITICGWCVTRKTRKSSAKWNRSSPCNLQPRDPMAHKRKDTQVAPPEWWRHLRPDNKRSSTKKERHAANRVIRDDENQTNPTENQGSQIVRVRPV